MSKKTAKTQKIDIGIGGGDRAKIVAGLTALLADSYTLYQMTHNFHWNVTGPHFNSLHAMFMTQYTEQWTALDDIAERIRALGHPAPGTYREFAKLSSIEEPKGGLAAMDMVRALVSAHEATARIAQGLSRGRGRTGPARGRPADAPPRGPRLDAAQPAGGVGWNPDGESRQDSTRFRLIGTRVGRRKLRRHLRRWRRFRPTCPGR